MVWAATAIAGVGAIAGIKSARDQAHAQNRAIEAGHTELLPGRASSVAGFDTQSANGTTTLSLNGAMSGGVMDAQRAFNFASNRAQDVLRPGGGVPVAVASADRGLNALEFGDISAFTGGARQSDALSRSALSSIFQIPGLEERVTASTLGNLRTQAAPEEQRQLESFQSFLHGSGRGAVTGAAGNEASIGGGALAAAFAQGQSRADIERQLQARTEGRAAGTHAEDLLTSAFNRFAQTQGLAGDLRGAARGVATEQFGRRVGLETLPANIADAFLGVAGRGLELPLAAQQGAIDLATLNLNERSAVANAQIGAGSNIAQIVGGANFSANPVADAFSSFAQGALPAGGINSLIGQIKNRVSPRQEPISPGSGHRL